MYEHLPSFFDGLTDDEVAAVTAQLTPCHFPAGALVLAMGDTQRGIYVVQSGEADILIQDGSGVEHCIAQVGPGDTLGEMGLFSGLPASATVRARSDLALLMVTEDNFDRVIAAAPRISRNLGAILSHRLARANRRAVREGRGHVTILHDQGAPHLLSYALASSLCWHTRASTLLLVVGDELPDDLALYIPVSVPLHPILRAAGFSLDIKASTMNGGIHVTCATPALTTTPAFPDLIDALAAVYNHVLVQSSSVPLNLPQTRIVRLTTPDGRLPATEKNRPGHTIRAWAGPGSSRSFHPDGHGVLWVPAFTPAEERVLHEGILPPTTRASRALGWAARDLAGLRVGLAFGAGGARGYAHIGVWRVLERVGLTADCVAGTSIGAAVGALYALGYSPDAAATILDTVGDAAWRLALPGTSLLSSAGLRERLGKISGTRRIEDLDCPLALIAADLVTRSEVVFRRGLLRSAVMASMAIPGIYPPVHMGHATLVDGGVLNPVPSDVAMALGADVVIAVKLASKPAPPTVAAEAADMPGKGPPAIQTIIRSIEMMQSRIGGHAVKGVTIQIEPHLSDLEDPGLRHFKQGRRYIGPGERAAEDALPRIAAALPWIARSATVS